MFCGPCEDLPKRRLTTFLRREVKPMGNKLLRYIVGVLLALLLMVLLAPKAC